MEDIFKEWCIVELFGHRKLAGLVTDMKIGAASLIRVDVPDSTGATMATQFYGPQAIYCITPTTKSMAIKAAALYEPHPVTRWELQPEKSDLQIKDYGHNLEEEQP